MTTSTPLPERVSAEKNVGMMFVHSLLDDYGLDLYEFRVYGHITRRTGGRIDGRAFASNKRMAEACGMSPRKLQYVLKVLCAAGLIVKEENNSYRTNLYRLAYPRDWMPKEALPAIRQSVK